MNAASGDNRHIGAVLNIEIIVYDINAFLTHNNRNMHLLVLCLAADMNVNARLVFLLYDMDMTAVAVADCHAVQSSGCMLPPA